jgi:hypothetical protein
VFGQSPAVFRRVEARLTFRRRPKPPQTRPKPDLWRPPKTPGPLTSDQRAEAEARAQEERKESEPITRAREAVSYARDWRDEAESALDEIEK